MMSSTIECDDCETETEHKRIYADVLQCTECGNKHYIQDNPPS